MSQIFCLRTGPQKRDEVRPDERFSHNGERFARCPPPNSHSRTWCTAAPRGEHHSSRDSRQRLTSPLPKSSSHVFFSAACKASMSDQACRQHLHGRRAACPVPAACRGPALANCLGVHLRDEMAVLPAHKRDRGHACRARSRVHLSRSRRTVGVRHSAQRCRRKRVIVVSQDGVVG